MNIAGCFCVFGDASSFEYIRISLEKTLLTNLEQEDKLPFQGLPLVIVFAASPILTDKEVMNLKEEGQGLAESLQCPFLEVTNPGGIEPGTTGVDSQFSSERIEDSLRALIESIRARTGLLKIYKPEPSSNSQAEPDIR